MVLYKVMLLPIYIILIDMWIKLILQNVMVEYLHRLFLLGALDLLVCFDMLAVISFLPFTYLLGRVAQSVKHWNLI